ncbi:Hormone-sensitive lipase [Sphaceloma murrayae]|uniref:Hormone-sensitive lipase n=1 Tax=Sphaceloma murrayae TaxID=2082308 RepID=A0A2K1R080_9PEZI|nr:Hormone-sensitive lipase [Sphaceloma murrayae]
MADYSNPEAVAALGTIDPELDALLKANPLPTPDWSDLQGFRKMRHQMELARGPNAEQAKLESTQTIPMRDGFESEIRIHRPADSTGSKRPLIVLLFGGGFIVGSNMQLGPYARAMAALYNAVVVTLNYRLAPEHKFPTQINDAWDSVSWLAKNAPSIGADPAAGFVLGGVSAGGNLTAVVAQKAKDEGLSPPLTGLWVCIPVLLTDETVPEKYKHLFFSRKQNENAPVFNMQAINRVDGYLEADHKSPLWSPFNTPGAHKGLPPAYFQVCGMDPLRDDGLIYEAVLRENGVKTRLDVYPGVPHAHFSYLPNLQSSKKAIVETVQGIGWLLGREVSAEEVSKVVTAPSGA